MSTIKKHTLPHLSKFVLRLPTALHHKAIHRARESRTSLNQICVESIRRFLEQGTASQQELAPFVKTILLMLKQNDIPALGIVLFGSTARGEERSSSDIDLLIVIDRSFPLSRKLYDMWDSTITTPTLSPQFVHLFIDPLEVGSLWYEAAMDGIILWEEDYRISKFLGKIRSYIADGKIQRVMAHGHPYWTKNITKQ